MPPTCRTLIALVALTTLSHAFTYNMHVDVNANVDASNGAVPIYMNICSNSTCSETYQFNNTFVQLNEYVYQVRPSNTAAFSKLTDATTVNFFAFQNVNLCLDVVRITGLPDVIVTVTGCLTMTNAPAPGTACTVLTTDFSGNAIYPGHPTFSSWNVYSQATCSFSKTNAVVLNPSYAYPPTVSFPIPVSFSYTMRIDVNSNRISNNRKHPIYFNLCESASNCTTTVWKIGAHPDNLIQKKTYFWNFTSGFNFANLAQANFFMVHIDELACFDRVDFVGQKIVEVPVLSGCFDQDNFTQTSCTLLTVDFTGTNPLNGKSWAQRIVDPCPYSYNASTQTINVSYILNYPTVNIGVTSASPTSAPTNMIGAGSRVGGGMGLLGLVAVLMVGFGRW